MHSCVAARGQSASEPWARASFAACAHLHVAPPSLPPYRRALRAPRSSSHRPRARPSPPAARPRAARPRLPLHRRRRTRSFSTACSTVMAYGQSGAGKTHTMEGARGVDGKGLIPRASELFSNPSLSSPLPSPVVNPMTPSTPWHITHPSLAGCRARRRLPRGHDVATRALRGHHGRRRALPRSFPRPAQLQRTRKLKHSCANRRVYFYLYLFPYVWENSVLTSCFV